MLIDHPEKAFIQELRDLGKSEDIMIDVGANAGMYCINLADLYPELIAVEPYPVFVQQLKANIAKFGIKNITIVEKAISDTRGNADFYGNFLCPSGRDCPSLKQVIGLSYEGRTKAMPLKLMNVETVTLADIVGDRHVGLVNVDTEGNEFEVLWGAQPVMNQIDVFHVEIHDWADRKAIRDFLEGFGFARLWERGLDNRPKGWLLAQR